MTVIGLCGGSGSGKTAVSEYLTSLGYPVFESDREYHRLTDTATDCVRALAEAFGKGILNLDGSLNRRSLAKVVFANNTGAEEKRKRLNEISHRFVKESFFAWRAKQEAAGQALAVLEAPLLFESGLDACCRYTIAVTAPDALRCSRIIARDGISVSEAEARIAAQIPSERLALLCDYTLDNAGTLEDMHTQVKQIIEDILDKEKNHE